jgi:EAL domain-containing protein (putative c-di-GMP-specific phosphodiesterase class I)
VQLLAVAAPADSGSPSAGDHPEATLTRMHELGIKLSIDDFGTGYSSMSYLKRLPIDELKATAVSSPGWTATPDDAALVRGIIDLGHLGHLGLTMVAEGVETAAHVAALAQARMRRGPGLPVRPADAGRSVHRLDAPANRTDSYRRPGAEMTRASAC